MVVIVDFEVLLGERSESDDERIVSSPLNLYWLDSTKRLKQRPTASGVEYAIDLMLTILSVHEYSLSGFVSTEGEIRARRDSFLSDVPFTDRYASVTARNSWRKSLWKRNLNVLSEDLGKSLYFGITRSLSSRSYSIRSRVSVAASYDWCWILFPPPFSRDLILRGSSEASYGLVIVVAAP